MMPAIVPCCRVRWRNEALNLLWRRRGDNDDHG
jgi:hypothetical protein